MPNIFEEFVNNLGKTIDTNEVVSEQEPQEKELIEFNYGDLVRIKTWDEMLSDKNNRLSTWENIHNRQIDESYSRDGRHLCGKKFVVRLGANRGYNSYLGELESISIYSPFVTLIERNYLQNRLDRTNKKQVEKIIENVDDDLIKEMITKVDIIKIKKILAGAMHKELKEMQGLDKMLLQWATAKKELYLLLNNSLKVSNKVELDLNEEIAKARMIEIINKFPQYYPILKHISYNSVMDNKIDCMHCFPDESGLNEKAESMKLTKFFSECFNNEKLNIELSKIYQDKILTNVTISIDPVDYLLMSKNRSGWKSCHNVYENEDTRGCYAGGTLSYLCDSSTLMAFTHSDEKMEFEIGKYKIKEYSKNWRQCVYYDSNTKAIAFSRQYPNGSIVKAQNVREIMEELVSKRFKTDNKWTLHKGSILRYYVENNEGALNYNDCGVYHLERSFPDCYCLAYNRNLVDNKELINIKIGSRPVCPVCGEDYVTDEEMLGCDDSCDEYEE